VTVERGAFFLSGHTPNVILTQPFRGEIGCEIEFEFPTDWAFGNQVRLLFANKAPQSYQDCEGGWLAAFGSGYGPQIHWHRGPVDAHELGGFWSKAPLIPTPPYYPTIPRRKYVARVEMMRDVLRVFQDGNLVTTVRRPEAAAVPTSPVFFGLSQFDSKTKVYAVRVYQLGPATPTTDPGRAAAEFLLKNGAIVAGTAGCRDKPGSASSNCTPRLSTTGRAAGCGKADAADLVQEVLLLLVKKLPDFH
jgi:hypothetical protein